MTPPPVYLDEQATTPLDPAVAAAMAAAPPGNPHSAHRHGAAAHAAVETARAHIAALIAAPPGTIAFTSGATEADNMALIGTMTAPGQTRRRIVTFATEHSAVLEPARWLAGLGVELTILGVAPDGLARMDELEAALGPDVALVSAMLVNNEVGVIQPISAIAAAAHRAGALVHCDAAQGFGRIPVDADALGIDLMSISGHKIYGPQGIGALYRRAGVPLAPLLHGGGQEPGRSGTVPVALAVGLGAAARIAATRMGTDAAHADALWDRALAALAPVRHCINGAVAPRWRGNMNVHFPGIDGARLLSDVARHVSLSSGAACASAAGRDSHVLAALGLGRAEARASLRMGWGRFTTAHDIDRALAVIVAAVRAQAPPHAHTRAANAANAATGAAGAAGAAA